MKSGPDGRFRLSGLPSWKGLSVMASLPGMDLNGGFSDVPVGIQDLVLRPENSKGKQGLTPYDKR